jgi:hypothetical protein
MTASFSMLTALAIRTKTRQRLDTHELWIALVHRRRLDAE